MLNRILKKIDWHKRILLTYFGFKRRFFINNYSIQIDFTHRLPDYQSTNRFYDRFLPHLAQYLPKNSLGAFILRCKTVIFLAKCSIMFFSTFSISIPF